mmetsp:Transcript_32231/g.71016  ORF Transcript_32231/g.71016 Transcript_32231/m.71016 type:complete len:206 (-) Transcript_32231:147-764(-)
MHAQLVLILLLLSLLSLCCSFSLHSLRPTRTSFASSASVSKASASASASARLSMSSKDEREQVTVEIDLGPDYKPVTCDFRPIFFNSTFFTVNYPVPFGLNIEKPPRGFPCPIVNKDSKREGGEMTGDVLRATTSWSQGFNAAGATSDIMQFAGNIKWRKSVFDTTGAPWQATVDALVSNTEERSESVTLVFERELPSNEPTAEE